jgi:hypothetical protein
MRRMNFRDGYEPDPYGAQGAGGLLGMLQALMRNSQDQEGVDAEPLQSRNARLSAPQAQDYGETPPTRITVRPNASYLPTDPENYGDENGLPGAMPVLPAEQGGYQPRRVDGGPIQFAMPDPNFRQVSRAPIASQPQGPVGTPNPIFSDASPEPIRPGLRYSQIFSLDPNEPIIKYNHYSPRIGAGIAEDQALSGLGGAAAAAALIAGATILNAKRRAPPSKKSDSSTDDDDEVHPDIWMENYWKGVRERAAARAKTGGKVKFSGPGDYCAERHEEEDKNCYKRSSDYAHKHFLAACQARARERRNMCVANKGQPDPSENPEWGLNDEEVFRNLSR